MPIKFRFNSGEWGCRRSSYTQIVLFTFCCIATFLPVSAQAQRSGLAVVKSQDNVNQWAEITSRLRLTGVAYCVVDLSGVKSAADWSDRAVMFLPNVELVSPSQAIALEEWMSKGGRVIASGPVGNTSQPGVRQLLRSLLGAYWGFSLTTPFNLQPLRTKSQEWTLSGVAGTVRGGVVIPSSLSSQPAAVWESKDNPPAVVTTERATVLGWRWGVDTASPAQLDSAWLRAALSRHLKLEAAQNKADETAAGNCIAPRETQAQLPNRPQPSPIVPNRPQSSPTVNRPQPPVQTAIAPLPVPIPRVTTVRPDEPIDRLEDPQGLEVTPNSTAPITSVDAIALQQELENLIGRVESAHLTADALGSREDKVAISQSPVASNQSPVTALSTPQAIAQAREIAKTLPTLIQERKYTAARQEWLKATQLLWNYYPSDRQLAQPEIRAMWLDRGTIVRARSEAGLAKIFDQMAAAGINTVFFETVNAGYPIYPSAIAPQQNPLVRGWDPLASGVKLAHERGIEIHAWVWTFAAGNQRHNALINLPADYPGPVLSAHPDWASYDNRGSLFPIGQGKPFLDPANPDVRRYLNRLFEEIVTRYDVDGLQLDYIRYPFQDPGADRTYGYGRAARQQFQQLTGADPAKISPRDRLLWQKWTDFRTQQIDTFVAEVRSSLRQKRPNLTLSVAVFPLSEHERLQKLQQHWELWARNGDVDLVVPMTYALDTYRFQRLAQPWLTSTKLGSALILPGIRLFNLPIPVAVDQIQLVRDLPVSGYALFAAENFGNQLQAIFQRTQAGFKQPLPHRQPFQTAEERYATLQREWQLMKENEQLKLREPELSAFNQQAEVVKNALNQLSKQPNSSNLAVAKSSLSAFQSKFAGWMRLQALSSPYQVKVWSNRLATVERLLDYGDRNLGN